MLNINTSSILIVNDINTTVKQLEATLPLHSTRVIRNELSVNDEFLIAQAVATIKEAYISSEQTKYILLCGSTFRKEAQNSLLKVLEEPPSKTVFIVITTSKTSLLPTILSRMPLKYLRTKTAIASCDLNILNLDLKEIYSFLKENQKITKQEAKEFVESLLIKINQQKIGVDKEVLDSFSTSIKLLDLNSRPINILTTLLLTFLHSRNRPLQRV